MADISKRRKDFSRETADIITYRNEPPSYNFEHNGVQVNLGHHKQVDNERDLAWCFAIAIWRKRHEISKVTLKNYVAFLVRWWEFKEERWPEIKTICEITNEVLNDYLFWSINLAERRLQRDGRDIHRVSLGTVKKWFQTITTILTHLQKEGKTHPSLVIPRGIFTGNIYENVKAYSQRERHSIVQACVRDIERIRRDQEVIENFKCNEDRLGMMNKLMPIALLLGIRTGLNSGVLLDLDADCVRKAYLGSGKRLRCPLKGRSGKSQYIPLTDKNAQNIRIRTREIDLINDVLNLTEKVRSRAPDHLKNKLWILETNSVSCEKEIKLFSQVSYYYFFESFVRRHQMISDQGKPLHLNFKRLRPTFAEGMLRASGGDINEVRKRMNHSSARVTMRYFDADSENRIATFKFSGLAMQRWALGSDGLPDRRELIKDLKLTEEEADKLLNGDFNMGVAKCKNPRKSPLKNVEEGELCREFLGCFRCANFVALSEDAHRLFSFYWHLKNKRNQIGEAKWLRAYQWIIDIIENDIAPKLGSPDWVESKMQEAKTNPHPMWNNRHFLEA